MLTIAQLVALNDKVIADWEKSNAYKSKAQRELADEYRGGKIVTKWECINGEVRCCIMGLGRNLLKYSKGRPVGGIHEYVYCTCE